MKEFKVVAYPIFGVLQFYLATQHPSAWLLYVLTGLGLIAAAILNLLTLTHNKIAMPDNQMQTDVGTDGKAKEKP